MIKYGDYRIVETKEEYLKDWDSNWERYDGGLSPFYISEIDKITFPIGLHYSSSWDPRCCGDWYMFPVEEIKAKIIQSCQDEIECLVNKIRRIEKIGVN